MRGPRILELGKWCPGAEFDALHRYHFSPDLQSNQLLSKIKDKVKRLILANSLVNSQGPRVVSHGPGLLEPYVSQIWISVKGGRWILGVGSCASDIGSGIGGGGGTEFCLVLCRIQLSGGS